METYGKEWDSLNDIQQKLLKQDNALLDNLRREAEYERTVFPFLEEIKKEQLVAGMEVEGRLSEPIRKEMARLKIRVGSLPRTFGKWTLNEERYEDYKDYIADNLEKSLAVTLQSSEWKERSKEEQLAFIEKAIEIARGQARTLVQIRALEND